MRISALLQGKNLCSKFKVQSANIVSLRDDINYLGPVVKPRDDKKREPCSTGPGPQDDKFLSSFYFKIFLYRHPGAGRDPLRRRYLCRRECDTIFAL